MVKMKPRIGLALSGGGAKGLAHIGVLKVLEENQIPIHMLSGTSMGGVVAAAYAAGRSADEIEQFARSLRPLDVVQRDSTGYGLLGQEKVAQVVRNAIGGDLTFDQLELPLALTAVDLHTGEEVIISEGSVVEGVLATTAVPIIFPPLQWQNRHLIDGGLLNPIPFDIVREMGAERVIAVHTLEGLYDPTEVKIRPQGQGAEAIIRLLLYQTRWTSLMNVVEHSWAIVNRRLAQQRLQQSPPDLLIEVTLKGVRLLDLDKIDLCLKSGMKAARQHVDELKTLRDTPSPSRWTRWWHSTLDRLRRE
jgi:NTE family protein